MTRKVAGRMQAAGRERTAELMRHRPEAAEAGAGTLRVVLDSGDLHPEPEAA